MTRATVVGLAGATVLDLDGSALSQRAADLRRGVGRLGDDGAQVSTRWRRLDTVYRSPVAPTLVVAMEPVAQLTTGLSGALVSAATVLDDYAHDVEVLKARHRAISADVADLSRVTAADASWAGDPLLRARQTRLQRSVSTLVADADDVQQQCVAALDGIQVPTVQVTGTFSGGTQAPMVESASGDRWWDPRHLFTSASLQAMSPAEVNAWWSSLSPAAQATYLATSPRVIGGLDGIPASVRDTANRSRLDRELARLTAERAAMGFFARNVTDRMRSDELNERIDAIASVRGVLDRGGRQLLHFDITGPEVLAAVAVGDVDRARYVGIIVGGMTTNVESGLEKMDSGAERLRDMAKSVDKSRASEIATVSWLSYAAPPELLDAANPAFARVGEGDLRSFTKGLSASSEHPSGEATITLAVHSYGTLVGTLATQADHGEVDNIVAYGSPGIAKTLPDDVDRYWMRNDDDLIRAAVNSGWFRYQPNSDDGWVELGTVSAKVDGDELTEGSGHDYLDKGTTTLHNIAAVVVGRPERAILR